MSGTIDKTQVFSATPTPIEPTTDVVLATAVNPAIDTTPSTQPAMLATTGTLGIGHQIGPYRILSELGAGGMGSVFLVEQREPVKRQVALKILHSGLLSKDMLNRFRAEGDVLARMNHPNIAQIFDFSATVDGRLFIAMEYVPGVPLVQFCNERGIGLKQRLDLFLQACEGVQHAHQKGVIHRDLKPSNVLVADYQGQLMVKIIDFGIAKSMDESGQVDVGSTLAGMPVGTPAYMSPEQATGDPSAIDTRSDVYAMGGVLYRLITDELPISADQIQRAMQTGLAAFLRDVVVVEPSKCVIQQGPHSAQAWRTAMGGDPASIAKLLRGDLDWITLKALARERDQRYASVSEFAADLRRHLQGEPVLASPPSRAYRLKKFIARNRLAVAASAAVIASLIAGIIGTTRMTLEARDQRARAEVALQQANVERERAIATKSFLEEMIVSPDPWKLQSSSQNVKDIKVLEALTQAGAKIGGNFDNDPGLRSEINTLLGRTLRRLSQLPAARVHLESAVKDANSVFGKDAPQRIQAEIELALLDAEAGDVKAASMRLDAALAALPAHVHLAEGTEEEARRTQAGLAQELGDVDRAERIARANLVLMKNRFGEKHATVSGARTALADILGSQAKWEEANVEMQLAYNEELQRFGNNHPVVIRLLGLRAALLHREGKYDDAEKLYRQAAQLSEQVLGLTHVDTLLQWSQVATALMDGGHADAAIPIFERIYPLRAQLLGEDHASVLTMQNNFGIALRASGQKAKSAEVFEAVYAKRRQVLGAEHPETLRSLMMLAQSAKDRGDFEAAAKQYEDVASGYNKVFGNNHPDAILNENYALATRREFGQATQTIDAYQALLARAKTALPPTHWYLASIHGNLGLALLEARRFSEAKTQLQASYDLLRKQFDANDARVLKAKQRLDDANKS